MHVRHLTVADFRSYESAELPLEPGVTTLVGLNGQGKTNLVEALGYLATLSSHRVATDAPLVRFGAEPGRRARRRGARRARDDGRARDHPGPRQPGAAEPLAAHPAPRRARAPCAPCCSPPRTSPWSRATPASGAASSTTCSSPASRAGPGCAPTTTRSSSSAGALLKSAAPVLRRGGRRGARPAYVEGSDAAAERDSALHTLDVWDSQLAQVGSHLLYARLRLLRDLGPYLGKAYDEVSAGQSDARVAYKSSLREETAARLAAGEVPEVEELRAEMLASLAEVRAQEVERGVCLVGPHRDDMVLTPRRAAGQGVRQPRGVVVVRARPQARGVPAAAARPRRRPGARARRRLRRARHRAARAAGRDDRRLRAGDHHGGRPGGRARRARRSHVSP